MNYRRFASHRVGPHARSTMDVATIDPSVSWTWPAQNKRKNTNKQFLETEQPNNMNETENQIRLRRAKEALASARETEATARRALNDAVEATKRAKERYEELFMAEERAETARRKSYYRHETK